MSKIIILILAVVLFAGCNLNKKSKDSKMIKSEVAETKKLSQESIKIRDYLNKDIVIAHRGSTYWAPEETEPAYRWARNIGSDYLELDLQMTKDSILVAMHDDTLLRTSNVNEVYPEIENPTVHDFTLKELRKLDFGTSFNKKNPDRARKSYVGTKILTLQDIIMIAEGFQIKKINDAPVKEIINKDWSGKYVYEKDPEDNKNRPGIYAETKTLHLEKLLAKELKTYDWLITDQPKKIETYTGKVAIANTKARFVLQTFYKKSIEQLNIYLPNIPKCLLIWRPDMKGDIKTEYINNINYCIENKVEIMGPSIAGAPNNYGELSAPWMVDLVHKSGMLVHPYTFDTNADLEKYAKNVDGVFTNRADLALIYYHRKSALSAEEILKKLGY